MLKEEKYIEEFVFFKKKKRSVFKKWKNSSEKIKIGLLVVLSLVWFQMFGVVQTIGLFSSLSSLYLALKLLNKYNPFGMLKDVGFKEVMRDFAAPGMLVMVSPILRIIS